ncbi:MAG: hypothetical protein GT601_17620 [Acidaminobacter sp.]|uniref:hypothetical protein n=1 Tax=Acidaminobacter sp. TaxID=1872102 RepID=UPI0013836527|nr:hypothetical protein [Acidaminobacter sp.]MZQ99489.1 hypothetical protein [Acidaminobacter sp.]
MSPEFIVITILYLALMAMFAYSDLRWQKERDALLKMAEIERQRLLDRIQAKDLPEFKAVQDQSERRKEPCEPKEELIQL